jgi:hypothetical protein
VAGDYVCAAGETPIPNIPEDVHPALAAAATMRAHIASENQKGLQLSSMAFSQKMKYLEDRAAQRVTNSPQKIVPRDHLLSSIRGGY